jgi:hypothetical protein
MSGFLFGRQQGQERSGVDAASKEDVERAVKAAVEAQSITTSAIFALLVSKGVVSAREAADYMHEIGGVLRREIEGPLGSDAGEVLSAYGDALVQADG